jgi:hypothetical protein
MINCCGKTPSDFKKVKICYSASCNVNLLSIEDLYNPDAL